MQIRLNHKVAIVTGSSQGIGRTVAELLADCGASLVINSHSNPIALEALADSVRKKGTRVKTVIADVTKRNDAQKLIDAALELGGIDILVNNVGGLVRRIPVAEFNEDHYQQVIDINLKTAFLMSHLVISHMRDKRSGKIINIASQAAHDGGGPGSAVYSASKGAVLTLTKSLAKELVPFGIHVNAVSPGFIAHTVFHQTHTAKKIHDRIPSLVPLGRKGEPDDVAHAVLFLASDLSDYITGQTIEVNGGLYMY